MHLSKNEISRKLYAHRKEQHLCTLCGNPMDREGCMCIKCLENHNRRYRKTKSFPRSDDENEKIDGEIWKVIDGFPNHEVSNKGRVRNKKTKRLLKPSIRWMYNTVSIRKPGERVSTTLHIHRLVCKAFIANPNNYPQVNHIDGNKLNNNVENLEWCTYSMNIKHAYDTGLREPIDHPLKKPILQIDKDNNVLNKFPSIKDAERKTGIRHIHEVISGAKYRKTAGGYFWRLAE